MKVSSNNIGFYYLIEYIEKKLNIGRFGEPYKTLLTEVLCRMQYVLKLTPEELKEDLDNFNNAVNRFRFDSLPERTMGWYNPNKREIVFNINYWQDKMNNLSEEAYTESFFETFAHECLHGMQFIKKGVSFINRAEGYNKKTKNRSHAIYEICTQAIAAKVARRKTSKDFENGEILSGDGYADEIFAVPLLASTFGISEEEVIKYGVRERSKLIEALNKHIGNLEYTAALLQEIEDQLELMHSIGYPDDNQKKFKKMSEEKKKELKTECIIKLVDLCQDAFSRRIVYTPNNCDNKTLRAYKFDQKKMLDTLRNEFDRFYYFINGNYFEVYFSDNAKYIKRALNVFDSILKDKTGKFLATRASILDCVKRGDFDSLKYYQIEDEQRDETFNVINSDIRTINKKREIAMINWDNTDLQNLLFNRELSTGPIPIVLNLNSWNEQRINSEEGKKKLKVLEDSFRMTSNKYNGEDLRYFLCKYLISEGSFDDYNLLKYSIPKDNGLRDRFTNEFPDFDISEKEFIVKLMAKEYLEKIYDFENSVERNINTVNEIERKIISYLIPTIKKYGKEHAMIAITKIILERTYDAVSRGDEDFNARENLILIGQKSFLDIISCPLMDKLIQERNIPDGIKDSVEYSIYKTELKYPGSIGKRIMKFVEDYNIKNIFNYNHFTRDGRAGLIENIKNREDLEAMIGVICNNFSEDITNGFNPPEINSLEYKNLIDQVGIDGFREAIISLVIDGDISNFPEGTRQYFSTVSNKDIISYIISSTFEKAKQLEIIRESNKNLPKYGVPVTVNDLRKNAENQKLSIITKFLSKLKGVFVKSESVKEPQQEDEIFK